MASFDALGFSWTRSRVPTLSAQSVLCVCTEFRRRRTTMVWNAMALEGSDLALAEVEALLQGRLHESLRFEHHQALRFASAIDCLLQQVERSLFDVSKSMFSELNRRIACTESLEWGVFRGEGREHTYSPCVGLGAHDVYTPLPTEKGAMRLNRVFHEGVAVLNECPPWERAIAFFLFGALQQFFFDGNKRTSRLMANGILLSFGISGFEIPFAREKEFNDEMVVFYRSRNADGMMAFLSSCQRDF